MQNTSTLDVQPILADVARLAPQARAQRHMTPEVIELLTKAGLFRAMLPRKFGGLELEPTAFFRALIQIAESDMSAGWIGGVVGIHPFQIALMGDAALSDVYGSSPDVRVSSSYNPSGSRTVTTSEGLLLSGRWAWSSGCQHSDWLLLGAVEEGDTLLSTCLVPMSACRIEDTWQYFYRGSYWRRGPITMTAIAAIDMALWDIKAKAANMPLSARQKSRK